MRGRARAGWVQDVFTTTVTVAPDKIEKIINNRGIFLAPFIATVVCAMVFLLIFREPEKKQMPARS